MRSDQPLVGREGGGGGGGGEIKIWLEGMSKLLAGGGGLHPIPPSSENSVK